MRIILLAIFGFVTLWEIDHSVANLRSSIIDRLEQWQSSLTLSQKYSAIQAYDRHGIHLGPLGTNKREYVPYSDIPTVVKQAFLSAEDKSFFSHFGLDIPAILRAQITNIFEGRIVQGASTITQQLVRSTFLDQERSYLRKAKEALIAVSLELKMPKEKIFELYLNRVFLGNHSYGISMAAFRYFGKRIEQLTTGEAALLAALPQAPSRLAPHRHFKKAIRRQRKILKLMHENGFIDRNSTQYWLKTAIQIQKKPESTQYGYALAFAQKTLLRKFDGLLHRDQKLTAHLSFDAHLHDQLHREVQKTYDLIRQNKSASSTDIQLAWLVFNGGSGEILSMQGGSSFQETEFNRSISTHRPMGQMIFPFITALALERGFSLEENIPEFKDSPSLFAAFKTQSRKDMTNLAAYLGSEDLKLFLETIGFSPHIGDLRLALGRDRASLLELAVGFNSILSPLQRVEPYVITQVQHHDQILYRQKKPLSSAPSHNNLFMRYLLADTPDTGLKYITLSDDRLDSWLIQARGNLIFALWIGSEYGRAPLTQHPGRHEQTLQQLAGRIDKILATEEKQFFSPNNKTPSALSFKSLWISEKGEKRQYYIPFLPNLSSKF